MFLYAKLVMDNLFHQPTRGDLIDAIRLEDFPDGLKEACVLMNPPIAPQRP